jgi:small subunit ribosomal protein S12
MTINQKIKNNNKKKPLKIKINPQIKGIVLKTLTMKPKKPNSALRKIVNVKIKNQIIKAYIPGIGHNLNQHSIILIKHGKTQDLPGVKHKVIRNVYDCSFVLNRKSSRSKYGTPKK